LSCSGNSASFGPTCGFTSVSMLVIRDNGVGMSTNGLTQVSASLGGGALRTGPSTASPIARCP
jgi:hypothetical protein